MPKYSRITRRSRCPLSWPRPRRPGRVTGKAVPHQVVDADRESSCKTCIRPMRRYRGGLEAVAPPGGVLFREMDHRGASLAPASVDALATSQRERTEQGPIRAFRRPPAQRFPQRAAFFLAGRLPTFSTNNASGRSAGGRGAVEGVGGSQSPLGDGAPAVLRRRASRARCARGLRRGRARRPRLGLPGCGRSCGATLLSRLCSADRAAEASGARSRSRARTC